MTNRLIRPALALSGWTLFVWLNRVKNVIDDRASVGGELAGWALTWRLGIAGVFCTMAIVGSVLVVVARRGASAGQPSRLAQFANNLFLALAGLGIVWWTVRGIGTLLADFSVGFKVVHSILALVTIGLGLVVLRVARLGPRYG